MSHELTSALLEFAARFELQLYHLEIGAPIKPTRDTPSKSQPTGPIQPTGHAAQPGGVAKAGQVCAWFNPLADRQLVYQVFKYLSRSLKIGIRCSAGGRNHTHIIICPRDVVYIFCNVTGYITRYNMETSDYTQRITTMPRNMDYFAFNDEPEWPSISFIVNDQLYRSNGGSKLLITIKPRGMFYPLPVIKCDSLHFKINTLYEWHRCVYRCMFTYNLGSYNIYVIDDLQHGIVNQPSLTFAGDYPQTFYAVIHRELLYMAHNSHIVTLDISKKIIIRCINPGLGPITGICFKNDYLLCAANDGSVYMLQF